MTSYTLPVYKLLLVIYCLLLHASLVASFVTLTQTTTRSICTSTMAFFAAALGITLRATAKPTNQPRVQNQYDVLIDCRLACAFGKLNSESIQTLDDSLKVLISSTIQALNGLPEKSSWDNVVDCVKKNPLIEPVPNGDVTRVDKLVKKGTNAFKFDGSPDPTIAKEVDIWFVRLVGDQDVLDLCNIDTKTLGDIVSQTGATVTSLATLVHKHEYHEANVLTMGVLRFPDIDNPYLKLYHIKLTAWSDCDRTLFVQDDRNGVTGECHIKKFRPCEYEIRRMSRSVKQKAVKEAEALFD